MLRGVARVRADEYLARFGRGLQAIRGVHGVAECGVVAAGSQCTDDHLAGVDADAEVRVDATFVAQPSQGLLHASSGPHRALGVVFVRDGGAEQTRSRHHP